MKFICTKISRLGIYLTIFLSVFVATTFLVGFGNNSTFDSAAWLAGNARGRGRMAQHLVDGGALIGRSAAESRHVLGAPDKDWGKIHQYQIDLGWPIKDPKTYGLQVHFNSNKTVREVKIVD